MRPLFITTSLKALLAAVLGAVLSYWASGSALGLWDPVRLHRIGEQAAVKRHRAAGPLLRRAMELYEKQDSKDLCRLDLADHYTDLGYSEHAIREYSGLVKGEGKAACAASFGLAAVLVREEEAAFWIPWIERTMQDAAALDGCAVAALSRFSGLVTECFATGRIGDAALLLRIAERHLCCEDDCGPVLKSFLAWMHGIERVRGFQPEL